MKWVFLNPEDKRFRAGWRILFQTMMAFVLVIILSLVIPTELVGSTYVMAAAVLISIAVATWLLDKRDVRSYGLNLNQHWFIECMKGFLAGFLAISGIVGVLALTGSIQFEGFGWERALPNGFLIPFFGYLGLMLVVGFYEEVWMRGYLLYNIKQGFTFPNFDERKALISGIGITSVIFGLLHAGNPGASFISTFNIMLAGVMLSLPVYFKRSLAIPVGLHASWNFCMGGIYGMPVSGTFFRESIIQTDLTGASWWTGAEFGPEAGVVGLLAMAALSGWMVMSLREKSS